MGRGRAKNWRGTCKVLPLKKKKEGGGGRIRFEVVLTLYTQLVAMLKGLQTFSNPLKRRGGGHE